MEGRVYDAFSDSSVNTQLDKKEQDRLLKRNQSDLRKVLSLPEGRRFIWRQLSESGVFRASFNFNTKLEDFHEGQRDRGLALLAEINNCDEDAFAKMQREYLSEQRSKPNQKEN